ncbi:hypothetical protein ANCCAN_00255 [Ancylostoma caninum]|uniref:Uncharacterized protein n=1 Tax=Ancylostoma caninum TaxID=29170 RepID=A0A368HAY6_ANCCA|nr:hypothetical protein ANCCAN_00255 [Ancylostoma caninum]
MASQPNEDKDVESHEGTELQNRPEMDVIPAPEKVVQSQLRLLTRIERDLRILMEKVDCNASLLKGIVQRLGRIERKLDDLLEWKGNIEEDAGFIRINGINEEE